MVSLTAAHGHAVRNRDRSSDTWDVGDVARAGVSKYESRFTEYESIHTIHGTTIKCDQVECLVTSKTRMFNHDAHRSNAERPWLT